MLFQILTIVGGVVAASAFIVARSPNARPLFERIRPCQGVLGIALLGVGIYHLVFGLLPNLSALTAMPLTLALVTTAVALDIAIGFVLGIAAIRPVLRGNASATPNAEAALARLVRVQVPMGLSAIAVGTVLLLGF